MEFVILINMYTVINMDNVYLYIQRSLYTFIDRMSILEEGEELMLLRALWIFFKKNKRLPLLREEKTKTTF